MKSVPVVATRLQPQFSTVPVLHRPRLDSPAPARLTFVVAPAGTGKSTLLASRGAAWLSLNESDGDLHTFLLYFLESLARRYPGICTASRNLLLGQSLLPEVPATLSTLLINELLEYEQPVAVVLDDLHLCFQPGVQQFLDFLLRHAPANFCLSVASRQQLDLPLPWLRARGLLRQVEESDLAFTLEESRQLVVEVWGLALSERRLELLWARTQGWVAALQLATQALLGRPADWESYLQGLTGAREEIYDYLASEVFSTLPAEIQSFARASSCLAEWNLELASFVSGQDATECCHYLRSHRLFLEEVEGSGFRFHPLFREFLWGQLKKKSDWPEVERRAADYWLQRDLPARAAPHLERLGQLDWLLEAHGLEMVLAGHQIQLTGWLQQLPAARVRGSSALSLVAGTLCELKGHWEDAEGHYLRAVRLGQDGAAWGHLCQAYLKCNRHDELLEACARGLRANPSAAVRAQLLAWRGATLVQTGQDWQLGYAEIVESYQLSRELPCPHARFAAAVAYGFVYLFGKGEIRASLRFLEEAVEEFLAGNQPLPAYFLTMDRAVVLLFSGSPETALRLVDETLLESRRAGHSFVYQGLETLKALIQLRNGDDDICQRIDVNDLSPQFRPYWLAELLRHQLRRGRLPEAGVAARHLISMGQGFYALEGNLAVAEWHRARGDEEAAQACLRANLELSRQTGATYWSERTSALLGESLPRPGLRIQSLGALRVWYQDQDLSAEVAGIPLKVLAVLISAGERFVSVDRIVEAIWPATEPRLGRRYLSVHLTRLRKLLRAPEPILRRGDQYRLNLGHLLEVDSVTFERVCRKARQLQRMGDAQALASAVDEAQALWKGTFWAEEVYLDCVSERRQELDQEYAWLQTVTLPEASHPKSEKRRVKP
ncbi:winged helix-turn-helix domain-containing protein [bacterium]|nr:winged helix-turn-helix domain-containing protein [bacterium]